MNLLPSISRWNIESRAEDMGRLFYEFPSFQKVRSGEYIFIKGRKGSGKTAIVEYIKGIKEYNHFSKSITFDRSPLQFFNEIGEADDFPVSTYVMIWRYVIYTSIVDLFASNQEMIRKIGSELENWYPTNPQKQLTTVLGRLSDRKFSAGIGENFLLPALNFSTEKKISHVDNGALSRNVEIIEDFINRNCDKSKYYVMFDGLDAELSDATRSLKSYEKQRNIIKGLVKACFDVRLNSRKRGHNIIPLVFIRTDMFDELRDSDSEKWEDFVCDLKWRKDQICNMLSHRICNSAEFQIDNRGFSSSWNLIFSGKPIEIINKKHNSILNIDSFDYIAKRTFFRPRDFIRYIQIVATVTDEYGADQNRISPHTIERSEDKYSKRFRKEIGDELHSVMRDVDHYLDAVSRVSHVRYFSYDQLREAFDKEGDFNREEFERIGLKNIMKYLFDYSVLGNIDRRKDMGTNRSFYFRTFKYNYSSAKVNFDEYFALHSGLFRGVFESKSRNSLALADSDVRDQQDEQYI